MAASSPYRTEKDRYNKVAFTPVTTSDLRLEVVVRIAVGLAIDGREGLRHALQREPARWHGHAELMALAEVAHVGNALEGERCARGCRLDDRGRLGLELGEELRQDRRFGAVEGHHAGARRLEGQRGHEEAQGREDSRGRRDHHLPDADPPRG